MLTTILAYVLVALFLGLEGRMRQGETARGLERGTFDRESTHLLGTAFAIPATWELY